MAFPFLTNFVHVFAYSLTLLNQKYTELNIIIWAENCYLLNRGLLYKEEFAPSGSKFFPYRVDPFTEGDWFVRKQTGSSKVVSLVKNCG